MDWNTIAVDIINGEKNPNAIVDIEEQLLGNDTEAILSSIKAIQTLFCHFLSMKEIDVRCNDDKFEKEESSETKYKNWLKSRYEDFKNHLIDYLHHDDEDIRKASVETLMQFVKAELPNSSVPEENKRWFPKEFYAKIVYKIIQSSEETLLHSFQDYLGFYDIKFHTLKAIIEILNTKNIDADEQLLRNTFILLCKVRFPKKFPDENSSDCLSVGNQSETGSKPFSVIKESVFRSSFSSVWLAFLKKRCSRILLRKVLLYLPNRVLPYLNNPLLLTDLLTDAYNEGGIISLLALNGIFFLMQNHNLEYPDFFKKLYSLLDIHVIRSKYRSRFFFLTDLFLSSILLPEYIVAAFAKKLSRLTLYATPDVLLIMLPLIKNLIIRHPGLKVLIHRPQGTELKEDPFLFEEESVEKCNALQSSLWEIKALQNHWHPDVATKAHFINSELGVIESDLSSVLDMDFDELIEREKSFKFTDCPLSMEILNQNKKLSWNL